MLCKTDTEYAKSPANSIVLVLFVLTVIGKLWIACATDMLQWKDRYTETILSRHYLA